MNKLKETKILGIIGNAIIILSLFLTWATAGSTQYESITKASQLISGSYGKLALLLSIISFLIIFAENIPIKFFESLTNIKLTYISSFIQLLIIVNSIHAYFTYSDSDIYMKFGLGFYLMIVGVFCMLIFPILYKQDIQKN